MNTVIDGLSAEFVAQGWWWARKRGFNNGFFAFRSFEALVADCHRRMSDANEWDDEAVSKFATGSLDWVRAVLLLDADAHVTVGRVSELAQYQVAEFNVLQLTPNCAPTVDRVRRGLAYAASF